MSESTVNPKLSQLQRRIETANVAATESVLDLFNTMLPGDPRDLYGDADGFFPSPPGGIPPYYWNNRGRGEVLPVYTTWLQLKYIRDRSRRLCRESPIAICATENRKNYIVGDGFNYRVTGPEKLTAPAQQMIDVWATAIDIADYELDAMQRLDMDGEFFLRFFPRDSGLVEIRFVEPEHVKDIAGDPWSPAESFGILTDMDDVETVLGYNVITRPWENDTPEVVKSENILHVRLNVPRNAKRGLPTFYAIERDIRRSDDLLSSMTAMAKTRAKIALIRKFLNASGAAVANMTNSLAAATITDPSTNQTKTLEKLPYGAILNSTGNIDYEMPGADVDAGGFVGVLQAQLRYIAARLNMPEWMLTADASNANLASSLVAEAPSTKQFRAIQRMLCRAFGESRSSRNKSAVWRQLEHGVNLGLLDPATLTEVKVQCEGPSLVVRDKSEEAQVNQAYLDMGVKSKATISQELGLDRKQELENISKDTKEHIAAIASNSPVAVQQQEEVQLATEVTDAKQHEHDPLGRYVQPEFLTPPFEHLTDPMDKLKEIQTRAMALNLDYKESVRLYQQEFEKLRQATTPGADGEPPDPALIDEIEADIRKAAQDVRKKHTAVATATKELQAVQPGVIKPDAKMFRRIIGSGPYAIISAGRNANNPEHADVPPEEFAERHKQLGLDLIADGRKIVELKGKYGGLEEPSWLAVMPKEHWHSADTHGYKYGQESIVRSEGGKNELKYVSGPQGGDYHTGVGYKETPDADDNYSEFTTADGEKVKFTLNFDFNQLHKAEEHVLPPNMLTGFSSSDFRDMLNSYLPPKEHVDDTHDPREVVKFYGDLSKTLKQRTGSTLAEVLRDHSKKKLHTDAGEAVVAALVGGPFVGHNRGPWDTEKTNKKGVKLAIDNKMTADPDINNVRFREGDVRRQQLEDSAIADDRFPVVVGFNPGHHGSGMIVAHHGTDTFPTRDTPDLRKKVLAGHAAVLAQFKDVDEFLKDPAAVAAAQQTWTQHANAVKPAHISTAKTDVTHRQALKWYKRVKTLAERGDKTAVKLLQDFE